MDNNNWSKIYKKKRQQSIWPWSKMIQFLKRNDLKINNTKVLEMGFGTGANIPFFLNEKAKYYGLEQSKIACKQVEKIYKKKNISLINTEILKFKTDIKFDIILDRGSLCCNKTSLQKKIIDKYFSLLGVGGHILLIDVFTYISPKSKLNDYTFCSKPNLIKYLKSTKIIDLEEIIIRSKLVKIKTFNALLKKI